MAKKNNKSWQLEDFIDSLVFELDKARETLSVKGLNSPLSYAVKDVSLDLNVFPEYDGRGVRFTTAATGDSGSSKISLSLGSITDRQIRETTKKPISGDDITIDEIDEIDESTKIQLNRMGVRSAEDIKKLKEKNVKVNKPVASSEEGKKGSSQIDFKKLAGLINKAQRGQHPPRVKAAQLGSIRGRNILAVQGENLAIDGSQALRAKLNNDEMKVIEASKDFLVIELSNARIKEVNDLTVQLDEHTAFNIKVRSNLK
ncbi:MAG: hypothetical protein ACFHU9_03985 [Fluviicola sp.]